MHVFRDVAEFRGRKGESRVAGSMGSQVVGQHGADPWLGQVCGQAQTGIGDSSWPARGLLQGVRAGAGAWGGWTRDPRCTEAVKTRRAHLQWSWLGLQKENMGSHEKTKISRTFQRV